VPFSAQWRFLLPNFVLQDIFPQKEIMAESAIAKATSGRIFGAVAFLLVII
jgi:hypothetical protein